MSEDRAFTIHSDDSYMSGDNTMDSEDGYVSEDRAFTIHSDDSYMSGDLHHGL